MLPWYIIEVTLEKQSYTQFRAEDGIVYERMHGTTVQRLGEAGLAGTRCDRCGELGHMARSGGTYHEGAYILPFEAFRSLNCNS